MTETEATTMASESSSLLGSEGCCNTCGIHKYWTPRMWECDACEKYFLCEDCYEGSLDDPELLSAHIGGHHMSPHVLCSDMLLKFHPSFSKPVDPQWSYNVADDMASCGFRWAKRKPMSGVLSGKESLIVHTLSNAVEDGGHPILKMEGQMNKSSTFKQALETSQTNRMFDKKHKIFLSHAGVEKDFVEQLHRDLSRVHHSGVFFDKEDGSLPKGEPFPKRIFDAAKHCELAVVVISKDYFLQKWPMLELTTFVEAQKVKPELMILPVFYKLSVEDFKKQQHSFMRSWTKMRLVSKDEMEKWKEALKVISRSNGLEYDKKLGEVSFRDRIVETIYKHVKPELMWDDSHVQGKPQMRQLIKEKIQMSRNATGEVLSTSTLRIGLFGVGGSGKTTMCKVFRNQMTPHYLGKVCHIEFGGVDLLHVRMKLLQSICQLDSSLLQSLDEGQALTLLKDHIPKQRVCLIIDNVSDNQSSIEEARTLLNLSFKEGSLILVTSRSPIILQNLKIAKRLIMRIPSLTTKEATALFSHHTGYDTSNLPKELKKVMENFVERCNFKVNGGTSQEYHPLALKVLGTRVGSNAEEWPNIRIDFQYHENEKEDPIFSILRSSFDALSVKYQKIFLDIALHVSTNCNIYLLMRGLERQMRCLYDETNKRFVSQVVEVLQAKSLVEFFDVETEVIYVHDLYREFARMEVEKKGLQHSSRCCFSRGSKCHHVVQERRVRIHNHPVSHITKDMMACTICSEAELLNIQDCTNLVSIDVPEMQNLRKFGVIGGCPQLRSVKLEGAVNLKDLTWDDFVGEYPDLTSLESLERLHLRNDEVLSPAALHGCLDFSRSSNLESLFLSYLPLNLLNLNQATLLKMLYFDNCQHLERLEGLEALVHLETLVLKACSFLVVFPSLANFPSLEDFLLIGATKLKAIHGFANLTALQVLLLDGAKELEELPGIEACIRLKKFSAWKCRSLDALPQFHHESVLDYLNISGTHVEDISGVTCCKQLQKLYCGETRITSLPDLSSLMSLEGLDVSGCKLLTRMDNITSLPALHRLWVSGCTSLLALPDFRSSTRLTELNLIDCPLLNPNLVMLPCGSTGDMEVEDGVDHHSIHSEHELENLTSGVMDFQEPEPAHNMCRSATLSNLVAKIASFCGGFGPD